MKKLPLILILAVLAPAPLPAAAGNRSAFGQLPDLYSPPLNRARPAPGAPAFPSSAARAGTLRTDDRYWITVHAADKHARTRLLEAGMDIVEIKDSDTLGFARPADMNAIEGQGFVIENRIPIYEYAQRHRKDFPEADSAYHNYRETEDFLRELVSKNPAEASLFSAGRTLEGREIWCLRLNATEKGETPGKKPAAFFVGNHHAREHLSNEVALGLASYLLAHKTDPEVKKYLETLDIFIMPMLNADGVEYDIRSYYQWQRKNMRINPDKTIGVDLNRNYDSTWCGTGASSAPDDPTYCGTAPFSEPETQAVRKFIADRKNIKTLMSYHSYGSMMLFPWSGKEEPVESDRDRTVFMRMAQNMAAINGYSAQQASSLYIASGETMDWAYATAGIFAFTTELEGNAFYPKPSIFETAIAKNVKAALYMLSVTGDPYKAAAR
jgi:carboxypeptidase T